MFLLNSRLGRFSAARFGSPMQRVHLTRAPLLPKLRGHFAEFLLHNSLEHLRLLASPTCVRLRYGHSKHSLTRLFLAVWDQSVCGLTASPSRLSGNGFADLPTNPTYALGPGIPGTRRCLPSCVPPSLKRPRGGTGILTCFPSPTPFGLGLGTD